MTRLRCATFAKFEVLQQRLCDRRGWCDADWLALPIDEQNKLLAWESQRADLLRKGIERALERSRTEDGKTYPETVIANLMLELVNVL